MLQAHDIYELQQVTGILAGGLNRGAETVLGVPTEVALTLAEARDQMRSLPGVIDNLNESFERFLTVSTALKRMIELADEASADIEDEAREAMESEFINLAKIVAADAGRQYYQGPQLSLRTKGHAWSAAKIIRYMEPVMANLETDLNEQKDLIHEVVRETIDFLNVVADCYPEAEGVGHLSQTITNAQGYRPAPSEASHLSDVNTSAFTEHGRGNTMDLWQTMSPAGALLN